MYRKENAATNLCQSIKNLFLNLQYFTYERYKIDFFVSTLKRDLMGMGDALNLDIDMLDVLKDRADQLAGEIDDELMTMMKLHELIIDFDKCREMDHDMRSLAIHDAIRRYSSDLGDKFNGVFYKFLDKQKDTPEYQPLKTISIKGSELTYEEYMRLKYYIQVELLKLEEWVHETDRKVLIMFEGRDAAGKSGAVNFLTEYMNPKHHKAKYFGIPSKRERRHWFERYTDALPEKGQIVFFDRTYYVRGYMDPIMGYCDEHQYEEFMNSVNRYEKLLKEDGIKVLKFWLSVDRNNQTLRFEKRKSDPLRYWKFSENDKKTIKKWDEFTQYINRILRKTNKHVKWRIINSNDELKSKVQMARQILEYFDYADKDLSFFDKPMSKDGIGDSRHMLPPQHEDKGRKVLFLDIDGVLIPAPRKDMVNHADFNRLRKWNPRDMENLNRVVADTKCDVIISSAYRHFKTLDEIRAAMKRAGYRHSIKGELPKGEEHHLLGDMTSGKHGVSRAKLVKDWISKHNITDYCVIDDSRHQFPELLAKGRIVKPHTDKGLTDKLADKAIEILNGKKI